MSFLYRIRQVYFQQRRRNLHMKILLWIIGIIFLIGLLVVTGVLKLIF
ncbi:hypothetical protein [Noviherbaspirillum denitrificans]|nr:hypothetical protein [Noviherbaspirillum denitrificans]